MLQRFFIFIILTGLLFSTVNTLYSDDAVIAHRADNVSGLLNDYYKEFNQPSTPHKNCNCVPKQAPIQDVLGSYYSELLK